MCARFYAGLSLKRKFRLEGSWRCLMLNLRNTSSTEIKYSGNKTQIIFPKLFFCNLIFPCKQETIKPSGSLVSQQSPNCNERRISKLFHNCVWMKHVFTVCKWTRHSVLLGFIRSHCLSWFGMCRKVGLLQKVLDRQTSVFQGTFPHYTKKKPNQQLHCKFLPQKSFNLILPYFAY